MKTLRIPALVGATIAMATAFVAGPVSAGGLSDRATRAAFADDSGGGDRGDSERPEGVRAEGTEAAVAGADELGSGSSPAASPEFGADLGPGGLDTDVIAAGALSAAHISPMALDGTAAGTRVDMIAAYERAMRAALAMPADSPAEITARNAAIRSARRDALASAAAQPLTPDVVGQVDALLGLPLTDPTLGL